MSTSDSEQCHALVGDGERCSRQAQDDGFCYQHDESDETIDDASADDSSGPDQANRGSGSERVEADGGSSTEDSSSSETTDNTDQSSDTDDADSSSEEEAEESSSEEEAEESSSEQTDETDSESSDSKGSSSTLMEVRNSAQTIGRDLIGAKTDGVIGVASTDDGWQVTLEVVERSAVPDTQDILGRYEIDLDSNYDATGYRRLERYRRGDTEREEIIE